MQLLGQIGPVGASPQIGVVTVVVLYICGGGRHLEFRKNVNNFGLDKDILHQIIWEDAQRRRGDDHVTESRDRK